MLSKPGLFSVKTLIFMSHPFELDQECLQVSWWKVVGKLVLVLSTYFNPVSNLFSATLVEIIKNKTLN